MKNTYDTYKVTLDTVEIALVHTNDIIAGNDMALLKLVFANMNNASVYRIAIVLL